MTITLTRNAPVDPTPPPRRQWRPILASVIIGLICALVIGVVVWDSPRISAMRAGTAEEMVHGDIPVGDVLFGAQVDWVTESPQSYTDSFGRSPYVYGKFVDFPMTEERRDSVDSSARQVADKNAILFITLQPYDGLSTVNPDSMAELTADLTRWNDMGAPVMVRFAHEMNGSWYPWAHQPAAYVQAFRQVASAVHAAPMSVTVWSPNDGGGYPFSGGKYEAEPGTPDFAALDTDGDGQLTESDDMYAPFYPGDDAVDWVGLSLYHFGDTYPWGANDIPEDHKFEDKLTGNYANEYFDQTAVPDFYERYVRETGKPMAISETAAVYNPAGEPQDNEFAIKQAWWSQVFSEHVRRTYPGIRLINWFEQNKLEADFAPQPIQWSVIDDRDTRTAFRRALPDWVIFAP